MDQEKEAKKADFMHPIVLAKGTTPCTTSNKGLFHPWGMSTLKLISKHT